MDVSTAPSETAYFAAPGLMSSHKWERTNDGGGKLTNLHVFKTGTFRDSRGRSHTYTQADLQEMANNFSELGKSTLPNVPLRVDHNRSASTVVGWFSAVRADGDNLFVDLEVTEPDAADKWERKTYRSRSLEVGAYMTNDDELFHNVVQGLAFVDLPAVEGLFSLSKEPVMTEAEFLAACEYAAWVEAATYAQYAADVDWAVAAGYAQGETDVTASFSKDEDLKPPHAFSLNGVEQMNYAAVQAHISSLEAFRAESLAAHRIGFIDTIVAEGKVAAPQADSLKAFAATMDDAQFGAFKASYEAAPATSLFANHTASGTPGTPRPGDEQPDELEIARATVKMHRQGGMTEEQIKNTSSFAKMVELDPALKGA